MFNSKNDKMTESRFSLYAVYALLFLLLSRVISIFLVPLNDTTEARYGEIARKMLETSNWVTPMHDYNVPFWAKPPLSTWLSAGSMKLFGVNEFAARLPGLLLSVGILWLIWGLVKKQSGQVIAMIAVLVLSGSLYFFLDAGTVMTDPSLLFCTTLAMVSFWYAINDSSVVWSYVFFAAIGLGLLAKGPIAVVLVGLSVFFWVLWRHAWVRLWQRLPWFSGTLLTLAIALPWYMLAEHRTPGFLNYFIMGEHVHRFLTPGWTGDKYGMAHDAPWGMIWLYAAAGIFPWSIIGCVWLSKYWKKLPVLLSDDTGWMSYIALCALAPLAFFTFSSNIIYPYVFPILPAYAILFAEFWMKTVQNRRYLNLIVLCSTTCGLIFLITTGFFLLDPELVAKTQKPIIRAWMAEHPKRGSQLVYWSGKLEFSAQFYSHGRAKFAQEMQKFCQLVSNDSENYLIINTQRVAEIPEALYAQFTPITKKYINGDDLILLRTPVLTC
jgi:4-amino-4-deoxy-L-arabinose transferase-like glycosyltransferase